MAFEIERKFLVTSDEFKQMGKPVLYKQGYIMITDNKIVRIRIAGEQGYITVKSKISDTTRREYEYEIPFSDAIELLYEMCYEGKIEKFRYKVMHEGHLWEVDEFHGLNEGLTVAEIELDSEDESFIKPSWLGTEVTDDPRYINAYLSLNPYSTWI